MCGVNSLTLAIPLFGLLIICQLSAPAGAQYGGGTGQADDPYLIYTAEQMNAIGANRNDWDKYFKLMSDIDLSQYSGTAFKIIGASSNSAFRGVFDGNGKKISRFTTTKRNSTGMFGYVDDSGAEIKNLGLIHPNIRAEGASNVGSLVGYLEKGTITNCYATGGSVSGKESVGGLVGYNEAVIRTSFWDIRTSGRDDMCGRELHSTGCNNANGKMTAEMKMERTFASAGWDFVAENVNGTDDIWSICKGLDYPRFVWQFRIGDFDGDTQVDFADFAIFAERWLGNDNPFFFCRGAEFTNDGKVDFKDLEEFTGNWLAESIGTLRGKSSLIIDDFESYNDLDPDDPESNRIFDTWLDGFGNSSTNGAVVGNFYPPFAEHNIVHGGRQSMPYSYNTFFKFSKAERSLNPPQDWTTKGAGALLLWFHGEESNFPAPMSIVLNGGPAVYHDNAEVTQVETWTQWSIDLKAFIDVDLTNVHSIAICFGDRNNPQAGGTGKVFFDDIQVYKPR